MKILFIILVVAAGAIVGWYVINNSDVSDVSQETKNVSAELPASKKVEPGTNVNPVVDAGPEHNDLVPGSRHSHYGATVSDADGDLASYEWNLKTCIDLKNDILVTCPPILENNAGSLSGSSPKIPVPVYVPQAANMRYQLELKVFDQRGAPGARTIAETTIKR